MPPSPPRATRRDALSSLTVSVVIAALNEEQNLPLVLAGLPPVDEVVVVDGGSTDATVAVARHVRPDAVVLRQTRTGKGNALACGFAGCTSDIVVTVNADGSTDPGELPRFVDALLSGADVAHGSRFRARGGRNAGHHPDRLGHLLSRLVNLLFGTRFTDLGHGYNAYWRTVLPLLDLPAPDGRRLRRGTRLWGDGPEIEPLVAIRAAAQGLRVVEVPSVGYPPIYGGRQRHAVRRALLAVRTVTVEYVRRWRLGGAAPDGPTATVTAGAARTGTGPPRSTTTRVPPARPGQPVATAPTSSGREWSGMRNAQDPPARARAEFEPAPGGWSVPADLPVGRHSAERGDRHGPRAVADRRNDHLLGDRQAPGAGDDTRRGSVRARHATRADVAEPRHDVPAAWPGPDARPQQAARTRVPRGRRAEQIEPREPGAAATRTAELRHRHPARSGVAGPPPDPRHPRRDPPGGRGTDHPGRSGYRTPADADRSWRVPDEPWRGTVEPWRGEDGEYHTGQHEAVADDGRPPSPVPADPPPSRPSHLRAVPGEPHRRGERR
jgi:Glycosyl transferase family 2